MKQEANAYEENFDNYVSENNKELGNDHLGDAVVKKEKSNSISKEAPKTTDNQPNKRQRKRAKEPRVGDE